MQGEDAKWVKNAFGVPFIARREQKLETSICLQKRKAAVRHERKISKLARSCVPTVFINWQRQLATYRIDGTFRGLVCKVLRAGGVDKLSRAVAKQRVIRYQACKTRVIIFVAQAVPTP